MNNSKSVIFPIRHILSIKFAFLIKLRKQLYQLSLSSKYQDLYQQCLLIYLYNIYLVLYLSILPYI